MKTGYARVSTGEQDCEPQIRKLREAGCGVIFHDDGESGSKASRPEWDKCLASLQPGDTLVAVRLDRFGRSVQHLLKLSEDLAVRGVDLVCTDQPIDSTTPVGRMVFVILAAVAEFERSIIQERTRDGLAAAAASGVQLGRKRTITDAQIRTAQRLKLAGVSVNEIAETVGVPRSSLYRYLNAAELAASA
jgi:DNA invertase Pin-like site-specific DNA recombinase